MYALSMVQYIKFVWKPRINRIFHKDETKFQKQLKTEEAAIFLKTSQGEITIDQNGWKIHEKLWSAHF